MDIPDAVLRRIAESHPASAAHGLEGVDPEQAAKVLDALPERVAAIVIERMTPLRAAFVLARLDVGSRYSCTGFPETIAPMGEGERPLSPGPGRDAAWGRRTGRSASPLGLAPA